MKKVIIIDDEAAGRTLINQYLEEYPSLIVIAEANNGVDAVTQINRFKPDLVFLDVQMPGLTGIEVLKHLDEIPKIIFSTAYDQYALKAFDLHAVDYLLKPYTRERFKQAIERLSENDRTNSVGNLTDKLLMEGESYPERILVEFHKKLITIETKEIIRVEAFGDYSKLHLADHTFVSNYGISALEAKLDPKLFLRVHRSSIINMTAIKELNKYGKSYDVVMSNSDVVRVSRGYMDVVKKLIF